MNCRDFRDIVDSYLSDELLTETNHEMIRHMEACGDCRSVIEARREIRGMLKKAVIASPEYRIDENFNHNLMTRIRFDSEKNERVSIFSFFTSRIFAIAAGLLVVALLSFAVITNLETAPDQKYLVSGFSTDSLMNIASGDHQYCAVEGDLTRPHDAFTTAGPGLEGLDTILKSELEPVMPGYKLVESHACEFKKVKFAHFVMSGNGERVSVLIAPKVPDQNAVDGPVNEFSSEAYRVLRFGVNQKAVFVISDAERGSRRKAADALFKPLEKHFSGKDNMQASFFNQLIASKNAG